MMKSNSASTFSISATISIEFNPISTSRECGWTSAVTEFCSRMVLTSERTRFSTLEVTFCIRNPPLAGSQDCNRDDHIRLQLGSVIPLRRYLTRDQMLFDNPLLGHRLRRCGELDCVLTANRSASS